MDTKELQKHLARHGFDPGPIDGVMGPRTRAAIIAFKRSRNLRPREYVGPITKVALREGINPPPAKMAIGRKNTHTLPPWLRIAHSYVGLREIVGPHHNAQIVSMWERLGLHFRDDETPWCAGFGNHMVQLADLAIPKKYRAAALGWRWAGHGTVLPGPALGAIMSITRPGRPGSGHMTIVAGRDRRGRIMGLGGNQGNMVSINPYHPTARDAEYRWPPGYPLPASSSFNALPIIDGTGKALTNEA